MRAMRSARVHKMRATDPPLELPEAARSAARWLCRASYVFDAARGTTAAHAARYYDATCHDADARHARAR